ncbi:MAG TPA: YdeI/OmpD-associated family protein [Anaerolineales bacterium]|nr:YdeI/OmpD-associated family protein [Anaerolineales bacterium]
MSSKVSPILSYQPKTRAEWRKWLATNHNTAKGIQLVIIRKNAEVAGITYSDAVEEALCFGWIDGRADSFDGQRYKLYMAPRKPGSVWSRLNKQRIRNLVKDGSMTSAGLAKIEAAKKDGSWTQLDAIDKLEMPEDLLEHLSANAEAKRNFEAFSNSSKKMILFWIANAKREETRRKRIEETVRLAEQNIKAAHRSQ